MKLTDTPKFGEKDGPSSYSIAARSVISFLNSKDNGLGELLPG
jgi:hypothetical protein